MSQPAERQLGKYLITGELGSGGMATVYRAIHPGLRVEVAIKVIRAHLSGHPSFRARFRLEAETLFHLNHPNILRLLDFDEADNTPYIVYPFVPGGTLRERLRGDPWSVADTAALLRPLADALDYAHGRGVVHRDIKPNNVLLEADGQPVVADFGLVRLLAVGTGTVDADEPTEAQLTSVGMAMGTPPYMAPEQALGQPVDGRADWGYPGFADK